MKQENTKEECLYNLNAKAEICPLSIPTYLPPDADMDNLRSFFTDFVERDLPQLTNVSIGQIVRLFEEVKVLSGTFDDKHNAVVDLFVQGMLEKRAEMLNQ